MKNYFNLKELLPAIRYNKIDAIDLANLELNDYAKEPEHIHIAHFDRRVMSLANLSDNTIAFGCNGGTIQIWQFTHDENGMHEKQIGNDLTGGHVSNHNLEIASMVELADDKNIVVSSSYDGHVCLWDRKGNNRLVVKLGQDGYRYTVRLYALPDGSLLGASFEGKLYHWDTRNLRARLDFENQPKIVAESYPNGNQTEPFYNVASVYNDGCVAASVDGPRGQNQGVLYIYDWSTKCLKRKANTFKNQQGGDAKSSLVNSRMNFCPDDANLMTISRPWGNFKGNVELKKRSPNAFSFLMPDGILVKGCINGYIHFIDVNSEECLHTINEDHTQGLNSNDIVALADGTILSISRYGHSVGAWRFPKRALQFKDIKPILKALKSNRSVKSFSLNGIQLSDEDVQALIECLASNLSLQVLDVRNTGINRNQLALIIAAAGKHKRLSMIEFSEEILAETSDSAGILTDITLEQDITAIKSNILTELTINTAKLNLFTSWRLISALLKSTSIQTVTLNVEALDYALFEKILGALTKHRTFNKLIINSKLIWNKKLTISLNNFLLTQTQLTSLHLANAQIGDDCAKVIAIGLANNISLTELNLANNKMTSDGAIMLIASLYLNTKLRTFNIDPNINMVDYAMFVNYKSIIQDLLKIKEMLDQKYPKIDEERFAYLNDVLMKRGYKDDICVKIANARQYLQTMSNQYVIFDTTTMQKPSTEEITKSQPIDPSAMRLSVQPKSAASTDSCSRWCKTGPVFGNGLSQSSTKIGSSVVALHQGLSCVTSI